MTVYSTDFSEYTTGVNLSDWTDFWGVGGFTYYAQANSGTYKVSTKWLDFNASADARRVLTWDDIGSISDCDILTKITIGPSISAIGTRAHARVSGTSGSENSYHATVQPGFIAIQKYVTGSASTIASKAVYILANKAYWLRFNVVGTALKCKIWAEDAVEPDDWTIETADGSLASGYCGVGQYYGTQDFTCDYFGCDNTGSTVTYPPSGFTYNDAFSNFESLELGSFLSTGKVMGGQFIDSSRKLKGVGVYCTDHSDDIRMAVYSGGSLSAGPAGATLLKDFGQTSGTTINDYVNIFTTDDIDVPAATPLWLVMKGDNVAGFQFTYSALSDHGHHGNYQIARGRGDVTAIIGNDPAVAFATTFPAGTTTFADYWYDTKIYLDGHPDVPVADVTIDLETGSYSLTGSDISLQELQIDLGAGSYSLTGSTIALAHNYALDLESGSYNITGTFINFSYLKVIATGWISTKGEGPWEFTEQPNKWGYLNNPRWTSQPTGAISYDGNEEDEPQIWVSEGEGNFSSGDSKVHIPCGHWHKTPVGGVENFIADIFTVHQGYYVVNERDFITGVRFYNDKLTYIGYYQAETLTTNLQALTVYNGDLVTIQDVDSDATLINISSMPYQGQFPYIQEFDTLSGYDITSIAGSTFEIVDDKYFLTSQNGRMIRFGNSWDREAYHYYGIVVNSPADGALYVCKYVPVFTGIPWNSPPNGGDNSYWHYIPEQSVDGPISVWGGPIWSIRSLVTGIMYYNNELYISQHQSPFREFKSYNPYTFDIIKRQLDTGGKFLAEAGNYLHTTHHAVAYYAGQCSKIDLSSTATYYFDEWVLYLIRVNNQLIVSTDSGVHILNPDTYENLFTLDVGNIERMLNLNDVYFIGVTSDTIYAFKLSSNTIIQIDSVSINENGLSGAECRGVVSINR